MQMQKDVLTGTKWKRKTKTSLNLTLAAKFLLLPLHGKQLTGKVSVNSLTPLLHLHLPPASSNLDAAFGNPPEDSSLRSLITLFGYRSKELFPFLASLTAYSLVDMDY